MAISDDKNLIFIHTPKNAGTSIIKGLNMYDEGHHKWFYYEKKYPNKWKNYIKFTTARNPYSRVISCYEYARMEESYYHSTKGKAIYGKHPDHDLLKNKSFKECIDILENQPNKLNHHGWEHQTNYFVDNEHNIMVDEIIYMENMNEELENKIGYTINKTLNKSKDSSLDEYYDDELYEKVRTIYKKDFEILGYG